MAVFDPETNIGRDVQYRERTKLCSALGLTELTDPEVALINIDLIVVQIIVNVLLRLLCCQKLCGFQR